MSAKVITENDQMVVYYHPTSKIVHHQMRKFCFGKNFRAGLSAGSEAMKKHRATKWLSDDRLNGVLPRDDEEWARTVWFPQTLAAGWKHWAIVVPKKVLGQMNMQRHAQHFAELGVESRLFSDFDEAMTWLETVDQK